MRSKSGNIIKAICIRIGVITHIVFLYMSFIWNDSELALIALFMFVGMVLICIEGLYTIIRRNGQDWKWGSPLLFIYISFAYLPCLVTYNIAEFRSMSSMNESEKCANLNEVNNNNQNLSTQNTEDFLTTSDARNGNLEVFFLIVIFARWSLPKGKITLEELSKLLLIYMSVIADILDMMKMVSNIKSSKCDQKLKTKFFDLSLSSLSLCILQLCLGLTVKKRSKNSHKQSNHFENRTEDSIYIRILKKIAKKLSELFEKEAWGIILLLLVKDVPFSILRTYALIAPPKDCQLWNQSIFFTLKNYVTIIIQLNRCYVLTNRFDSNENHSESSHHENNHNNNNNRNHNTPNNYLNKQNANASTNLRNLNNKDYSPFSITSSSNAYSTSITSASSTLTLNKLDSNTNNVDSKFPIFNLNLKKNKVSSTNAISTSTNYTNTSNLNNISEISDNNTSITNNNFYL